MFIEPLGEMSLLAHLVGVSLHDCSFFSGTFKRSSRLPSWKTVFYIDVAYRQEKNNPREVGR